MTKIQQNNHTPYELHMAGFHINRWQNPAGKVCVSKKYGDGKIAVRYQYPLDIGNETHLCSVDSSSAPLDSQKYHNKWNTVDSAAETVLDKICTGGLPYLSVEEKEKWGKYPPAKPEALIREPLKAARSGLSANSIYWPPKGD